MVKCQYIAASVITGNPGDSGYTGSGAGHRVGILQEGGVMQFSLAAPRVMYWGVVLCARMCPDPNCGGSCGIKTYHTGLHKCKVCGLEYV